ncbi:MAG: hypothetical protein KDA37_00925 [Planctomycetales bacterium]|nr:hypothetical protein [Planctomycetales bacterium]
MTERTNLYRKLAYVVAMALLLFPLSYFGSPMSYKYSPEGKPIEGQGGYLAEFRSDNGLAQANLGDIDPASETLKLATLGLRGVAVSQLWSKANEYKMKEDWGNLTATLEQLSKLQPNFITFWKYQAWNLTYNVSVEFDDYRDRYYYVRRGIQFLEQGEEYNRENPQIQWELGWFIGQKIGRADEKVQYRRLFRNDDVFHPEDRPLDQRDNWLVSKEWYRIADRSADKRGIGRKSPIVFYSSAPKSQINYADAIESEGEFDRGLAAWKLAGREWDGFGNAELEHSTGTLLHLNDEESLQEELDALRQKLKELAPEVATAYLEGLRSGLSPEQQEALDTPSDERSVEQLGLAMQAERMLTPEDQVLVSKIVEAHPDKRVAALRLNEELNHVADRLRKTKNYKQTANFDYWKLRCTFEQTPAAIDAHRYCYQAKQVMINDANAERAKELYEQGLAKWQEVLEAFPGLRDRDGTTGDDILVYIIEYAAVLEKIDEEMPDDFPLWDIIEHFDFDGALSEEMEVHKKRMGENAAGGSAVEDAPEAAPDQEDPQDAVDSASPNEPAAPAAADSQHDNAIDAEQQSGDAE